MTRRKTHLARKNPAAFGTVERRGDRFRAFYRREGEVIRAPKTFESVKAAHAWLAKEAAAHGAGTWIDPRAGADTLEEYARSWLESRHDLAPRTRANYQHSLERWILPTLGSERLDAITPAKVRSWHTDARRRAAAGDHGGERRTGPHPARIWARAQGMSVPATGRPSRALLEAWQAAGAPAPGKRRTDGAAAVAAAYRVLRAIMNAAEREGVIARTPCRLPGAGASPAKERVPATPEQVRALADTMPARYAAAVILAAWSGLRSGELRALARRHVDLEAGTVRVERAVVELRGEPRTFGPTKTAGSRRHVALPGFVVAVLRDHMAAHVPAGEDALVFGTEAGGILGSAWLGVAFRAAQERAGLAHLALRWHDLRHTGASLAYAAGASVPDVQRRLGHTTMRAAAIYAHAYADADHALAARLDAAFGGAS